jgi:hypothetical protein
VRYRQQDYGYAVDTKYKYVQRQAKVSMIVERSTDVEEGI